MRKKMMSWKEDHENLKKKFYFWRTILKMYNEIITKSKILEKVKIVLYKFVYNNLSSVQLNRFCRLKIFQTFRGRRHIIFNDFNYDVFNISTLTICKTVFCFKAMLITECIFFVIFWERFRQEEFDCLFFLCSIILPS